MPTINPITSAYLKLLEWFAGFLVLFAEALESLFGPGVRNGVWGPSSHRSDVVKELDQANPFTQTVNVFENVEDEGLTPFTPRQIAFDSSPQMTKKAFSYQAENTDDFNSRFLDYCSDDSSAPKAFNPFDPDEPLSVYNGDPLNFDQSFHPDPFDSNN